MKITQIIGARKLGHVMIDLETMGNKSRAAIISIGAVEFDIETGETGDKFYANVDLQSSLDAGLEVNGDTIGWWLEQSDEARKRVMQETEPLEIVLKEFSLWFSLFGKHVQVWGNSARFDLGILEDAYEALGLTIPWNFRNERDLRTLVSFYPEMKDKQNFKGVEHDPIDDCEFQISYATAIWQKI